MCDNNNEGKRDLHPPNNMLEEFVDANENVTYKNQNAIIINDELVVKVFEKCPKSFLAMITDPIHVEANGSTVADAVNRCTKALKKQAETWSEVASIQTHDYNPIDEFPYIDKFRTSPGWETQTFGVPDEEAKFTRYEGSDLLVVTFKALGKDDVCAKITWNMGENEFKKAVWADNAKDAFESAKSKLKSELKGFAFEAQTCIDDLDKDWI